MPKAHFVIIGNGPAGNQASLTLREKAPEARITLISRSREACYRPRLLHLERKELVLDHKEVLNFTGLIIAVGGKPWIPEPLLVFRDLLFTLKTVEDARVWIERLSQVESILILGGDLTSFAVTKALRQLDKKVYFMVDEDAFWPLRPNKELIDEASDRLCQRGVHVLKCRRLKRITPLSDHLFEVLADDQNIEAGMIGAFFGLIPDIRFLARSGLSMDRGILVDEYLNTGSEGIYATGDCAQIYHPEIQDYWISIGHENAMALGEIAALNLVGGKVQAEVAKESIYDVQGIRVNTSWWKEY
jgi:nitrite reductase (NADH) large subunit